MTTTPGTVDRPAATDPGQPDPVTQRSIGQTFDFLRAAVGNPSLLDEIPEGSTLILIPTDDPELAAAEIEAGMAAVRHGKDVYFRHARAGDRA